MNNHWHPTPEDAHRAVELVSQGKCATQIAHVLFPLIGSKKEKKQQLHRNIIRVKSLLNFARETGIMILRSETNTELQTALAARYDHKVTFHVVNNDHLLNSENPELDDALRADAVCQHAAEVVATKISQLLARPRSSKKRIVIANSGGLAVSKIVRFLAGHKLVPEETDPGQLLFISLNSASIPTAYGYSANTLAVRMAEIYGGRHIALSPIWPADIKREYHEAVQNIDLLVCGAGASNGLLFTWLRDQVKIGLPKDAIGDICLIPISAEGQEMHLEMTGPELVQKYLRPAPSYADLKSVATLDGVVFVALGYRMDYQLRPAGGGPRPPHSKLAVTRAILGRGLARTCVLGTTLARDLLESK